MKYSPLNALAVAPDDPGATRMLGVSLYELGEFAAALAPLARAGYLAPADLEVRVRLGALYLWMARRAEAA